MSGVRRAFSVLTVALVGWTICTYLVPLSPEPAAQLLVYFSLLFLWQLALWTALAPKRSGEGGVLRNLAVGMLMGSLSGGLTAGFIGGYVGGLIGTAVGGVFGVKGRHRPISAEEANGS